jgi:uncharacterized protein (TIGR02147 family)
LNGKGLYSSPFFSDWNYISKMLNVFDYLDYRQFLKDFYYYKKKKSHFFSYRYMSQKLGVDSSMVIKVIQGKRHIASNSFEKMTQLCAFNEGEAEYFENLVLYCKAKSEAAQKNQLDRLILLKGVHKKTISDDHYEFFRNWYHQAVRIFLHLNPTLIDTKEIGDSMIPSLSEAQVKESLRLLQNLGFVRFEDGCWVLNDGIVTTGENWVGSEINDFQVQTQKLGLEAIERFEKKDRDISTLTVSLGEKSLEEIRILTREYRQSVLRVLEKDDEYDRVFHLNIQLFPMSKLRKG